MTTLQPSKPLFSDYQYIIAYAIIIILFMFMIRTRFGYVTAYYMLSLYLFVLILLNSHIITKLLDPISPKPEAQ